MFTTAGSWENACYLENSDNILADKQTVYRENGGKCKKCARAEGLEYQTEGSSLYLGDGAIGFSSSKKTKGILDSSEGQNKKISFTAIVHI